MQKRQEKVVRRIKKFSKLLIDAHKLRGKIEDIKIKIKKLFEDRINYDIKPLEEGTQTSAQECQYEDSSEQNFQLVGVVGFQTETDEVVELLRKEPDKRYRVVSITCMGGLGKSTLARKIYDSGDVQRHFPCRAYVTISKKYNMRDVLFNIIDQVMVLTETQKKEWALLEKKFLQEKLSDFLKERKTYLLVLDDVWTKEDWNDLRTILVIGEGLKCRVFLTTRDAEVAIHADPNVKPYELKLMDEEKSLKLFWRAFYQSENDKDIEEARLANLDKAMKEVAADIARECDGLPLAIVVLAGLLSEIRPGTHTQWKEVLEHVKSHLGTSLCQVALRLSYTELPSYLKSCFLYFGFFPEDTIIKRERLIQLWVAEGFLDQEENSRMEDVAAKHLEKLMRRNLIQVKEWKSNGQPESFTIHDVFLKLAISEANEGNFLNISTLQDSLKIYRRVALHGKFSDQDAADNPSSSNFLRSLLCFTEMSSPSLCGQFNLLTVLDLEVAPDIESLPKEIGKLIFLKYLRLCGSGLKTLPPWVGNLYNLQTLDLCKTSVYPLPSEILKLDKLRHLLCTSEISEWRSDDSFVKSDIGIYGHASPPRNLSNLSHLQTLWLEAGNWIIYDLHLLTNLRDLRIYGSREFLMTKFQEEFSWALRNLVRLEVLHLLGETIQCKIFLPSFSHHVNLYDLHIVGRLRNLPDHVNFPRNLTSLQLNGSRLNEDMMVTLEQLPQLKDLTLAWKPYNGVVMKCSKRGFPKLENLILYGFDWLRYWIVEKGAMPNLNTLGISHLYGLKCIPSGLRHIKTLQKLVVAMPKEFLERIKEGGKDWEKIKHVPSINTWKVENPEEISQKLDEYEVQWFTSMGKITSLDT